MGNVKDEGKKMDPLFPRLHISDADKGAPRTPPRNKMAISHQFNVSSSQTAQKSISGSVSPVLPLSPNNGSRLVPSTSSYHDSSYKRSVFSSFGRSCGSTRLSTRLDSYHSTDINLNISLTTVKQTIEHKKRVDYCSYKPQDFATTRNNNTIVKNIGVGDEDDHLVPSFTLNKGSFPSLTTNVYQKQLKLTDKDTTLDIVKEPMACYSDRSRFSDEEMLHEPNVRLPLKRKGFQENMGYKDGTKKLWTLWGDDMKTDRVESEVFGSITKCEEDHDSLHLEEDLLSEFNIRPGEVSRIIGQEQYCIARRTIIRQQRVFKSQLFELHRLIKVQKILAESPDLLTVDKQKQNNNTEKPYNHHGLLLDLPPPPPPPPPPPIGGKQPPWCFLPPPPPGNQWLVPVRSPSEGLVYKPLPPPVSLLPPVYGMSLPPSSSDFLTGGSSSYTIPTCYHQSVGVFPMTSYGFSAMTKGVCSPPAIDEGLINCSKRLCNYVESDDGRKKGDELPLFPTTPTVRASGECTEKGFDEGMKVIKVVPRNPKLASESAARIFQFIQEERKHNDS